MLDGVVIADDLGEDRFAAVLIIFCDRARVTRVEQFAVLHPRVVAIVQTEGGGKKIDA